MHASSSFRNLTLAVLLLSGAVAVPWMLRLWNSGDEVLVVYCAHDSLFADSIIRKFELETGIQVQVRYDEEANKSLGLTNLLIAEKAQPRCDVFWNNQTLGTIRLKQEGVLAPMDPSLSQHVPEQFRDPDNQWTGFAARLRVYLINTDRMSGSAEAIEEALKAESLANAAIAVPLFGTTLSHYAVLCDQLGLDGLQAWHQSLHDRGIREVRGNGSVKDLVAEGACHFGFTDTDDAFAAIDAGRPVQMFPVRLKSGETICLPNSVAMIRNCRHPVAAERFISYLLSEEVETALARSASRQIPLGPVDRRQLSPEVQQLMEWAAQGISLEGAAQCDQIVLDWLTHEYTGG